MIISQTNNKENISPGKSTPVFIGEYNSSNYINAK